MIVFDFFPERKFTFVLDKIAVSPGCQTSETRLDKDSNIITTNSYLKASIYYELHDKEHILNSPTTAMYIGLFKSSLPGENNQVTIDDLECLRCPYTIFKIVSLGSDIYVMIKVKSKGCGYFRLSCNAI